MKSWTSYFYLSFVWTFIALGSYHFSKVKASHYHRSPASLDQRPVQVFYDASFKL